jgi:ABC-type transport system substrate-binding protein
MGITVDVVVVRNETWWPTFYMAGEWDMALQSWTPMGDPHFVFGRRYASNGIHNAVGYSNTTLDRLVRDGCSVSAPERRATVYSEAEALRARDLPTLYLAHADRVVWAHPEVTGVRARANWHIDLDLSKVRKVDTK